LKKQLQDKLQEADCTPTAAASATVKVSSSTDAESAHSTAEVLEGARAQQVKPKHAYYD
jgi:hypothetical protein